MKVETKLNVGQNVFLLKYNSIVDGYVRRVKAVEALDSSGEIHSVFITYEIKHKNASSYEEISEDNLEKENLYINREDCRKALILKVMDM